MADKQILQSLFYSVMQKEIAFDVPAKWKMITMVDLGPCSLTPVFRSDLWKTLTLSDYVVKLSRHPAPTFCSTLQLVTMPSSKLSFLLLADYEWKLTETRLPFEVKRKPPVLREDALGHEHIITVRGFSFIGLQLRFVSFYNELGTWTLPASQQQELVYDEAR